MSAQNNLAAAGAVRREKLRILRKMLEPEAVLSELGEGDLGVFVRRNRWRRPVLSLPASYLGVFLSDGLIVRAAHPAPEECEVDRFRAHYRISEAGRAWWRRQSGGAEPFRSQHMLPGVRHVDEGARGMVTRRVNQGESPLGWLRQRKGTGGKPFLSDAEFDAGDTLRKDYELAGLRARVTANWDGFAAPAKATHGSRAELSDLALAARRRLETARSAVGPGLWDVLLETCCHLHGLEQAERTLNWPRRSAKLVLKIALGQLAAHYAGTGSDVGAGTEAQRGAKR